MAIGVPSLVASTFNKTGQTTTTITVGSNVASGGSLVLFAAYDISSAGNITVTDTPGNTYVLRLDLDASGTANLAAFVVDNFLGFTSGNTITITWTTTTTPKAIAVYKVTGLDSSPYFSAAGAYGGSTTPNSGNTVSTTGETIAFGLVSVEGPTGDSYTEDTTQSYTGLTVVGTTGGGATSNQTLRHAYYISSTNEAKQYSPNLGTSRNWAAGCLVLKAAAPGSDLSSSGSSTASATGKSNAASPASSAGITTVANAVSNALKAAAGSSESQAFGRYKLAASTAGAAITLGSDFETVTTTSTTASSIRGDVAIPLGKDSYYEFEVSALPSSSFYVGIADSSLSSSNNVPNQGAFLVSPSDIGVRWGFHFQTISPTECVRRSYRDGVLNSTHTLTSVVFPAVGTDVSGIACKFYFKESDWTQTAGSFARQPIRGLVDALGSKLLTGVGASAGATTTATATGVAANLAVAASAGVTTTASATGRATTNGQAAAAGTVTASNAVGTGLKPAVGASAGVATTQAQSGSSIAQLASNGVATVQATGRATTNAVLASTGVATAQATGAALFNGRTTSVGIANLNGIGRSTTNAVASAAGVTTVANAPGANVRQAQASSAGVAVGAGVSAASKEAVFTADGVALAIGDGRAVGFFDAVGTAEEAMSEGLAIGESFGDMVGGSASLSVCAAVAKQRGWAKGQHAGKVWNKQESA